VEEYRTEFQRDGFVLIPGFIPPATINSIIEQLAKAPTGQTSSIRNNKAFGIRNLLNVVPATRVLANSPSLRKLVEFVLDEKSLVVRGILLDKHKDANWKVAWHQDLTIAVKERKDVEGYGPWSMKAGIQHVQPPVRILESMVAARVHLDDTDESNGALRVVPGSHLQGRLSAEEIQALKLQAVSCPIKRGDVMLMRPLLLHASSVATVPGHRRVLHFEYAAGELDGGLEWYEGMSGEL
jgi:hypothetical protein